MTEISLYLPEGKARIMFRLIIKISLIISIMTFALQAREINIDKLIDTATSSNKHLFIFLHKTDCAYCVKMIDFTLNDDLIKELIEKYFVYEHINISDKDVITYKGFKGNGQEFAKHVGYDLYPSSLFFAENKEIIFGEAGYIDSNILPNEKRFYVILKYIQSQSYKERDYDRYIFDMQEEL